MHATINLWWNECDHHQFWIFQFSTLFFPLTIMKICLQSISLQSLRCSITCRTTYSLWPQNDFMSSRPTFDTWCFTTTWGIEHRPIFTFRRRLCCAAPLSLMHNYEHCQAHRAQRRTRNFVRVFILDNKMQESRLELVFFKTAAQLTVETNEHKLKWKMQVNSLPIQPKQKQLAFATHYYTVEQWD